MMGYYSSLHPSMWGFGSNAPAAKQYSSTGFGYPHHPLPQSQSNPNHFSTSHLKSEWDSKSQQQQQQHQHLQTPLSAPSSSSIKQESLKCEQPATSDYSTGSSSTASQQQPQQQQANLSPSPPSPLETASSPYSQSKVSSQTEAPQTSAPSSSPPTAYPYFSSVTSTTAAPASSSALSPAYYSSATSSPASYHKHTCQLVVQHPVSKTGRARPKSTAGMFSGQRRRDDFALNAIVISICRRERVRQLRRKLDSAVETRRQWQLPLQRLRALLQDERDQQAARQAQEANGE